MIKRGIGFLILLTGGLLFALGALAGGVDFYVSHHGGQPNAPLAPFVLVAILGAGTAWVGKRMALPNGWRGKRPASQLDASGPTTIPKHLSKAVYAVLAKFNDDPLKAGAADIKSTFEEAGLNQKYYAAAKFAVYQSVLAKADDGDRQITGMGDWGKSIGVSDEDLGLAAKKCRFAIKRARKMLSDGVLSDGEREELEAIGRNLHASIEVRGWIDHAARAEVEEVAAAQDRVDQEEMDRLSRILQVYRHAISPDTVHKIDNMHHMWMLESGPITPVAAPFPLQRGEVCAFIGSVNYLKRKTKTITKGYSGVGVSFRVARGVYLRSGRSHPIRSTKEVIELVDSGRLALTNKRLIFIGAKGSSTIQLSKIVGVEPYTDGVAIAKGAGASPMYQFCDGTTGEFMILLSRFLNNVGA